MSIERAPLPYVKRDNAGLGATDADLVVVGTDVRIPVADERTPTRLSALLGCRRSDRTFGPLDRLDLMALLSRIARPEREWIAPDGYKEQQRPAPSAGARHPHTLLVIANEVNDLDSGAYVFSSGVLRVLDPSFESSVIALSLAAQAAIRASGPPPAIIVALARSRRTTSKYPSPWGDELVLLDAGVLLGFLHLLAFDLGLSSVIAGIGSATQLTINGTQEVLTVTGALAVGGSTDRRPAA